MAPVSDAGPLVTVRAAWACLKAPGPMRCGACGTRCRVAGAVAHCTAPRSGSARRVPSALMATTAAGGAVACAGRWRTHSSQAAYHAHTVTHLLTATSPLPQVSRDWMSLLDLQLCLGLFILLSTWFCFPP